jgi:hypothetical protein
MPYSPKPGDNLIQTFAQLAIPMIINFLLIFYIIFECVCTGFAELSYFADREFYQDWWNSTSWDEFSRKWNKPVHTFLLRHVYASSRSGLRLGRWGATFFTFLLSALCHELVMAVVSKKIRPYLFLMQVSEAEVAASISAWTSLEPRSLQMIQLPMIMISRLPAVKRNRTLGNIIFWAGLMLGFRESCLLSRRIYQADPSSVRDLLSSLLDSAARCCRRAYSCTVCIDTLLLGGALVRCGRLSRDQVCPRARLGATGHNPGKPLCHHSGVANLLNTIPSRFSIPVPLRRKSRPVDRTRSIAPFCSPFACQRPTRLGEGADKELRRKWH